MKKLRNSNWDQNISTQSLEQVMTDRFKRFAKYNIQERALPDVRDGLKPVQRRILFSMYELGLFPTKPYKKSARVVGEVIGKYHPHGDTSIYDALIRLAQEWKMNVPLVEIHGNKGSMDDDPAAAMRYTEARLSALSLEILKNLNKDTVKFAPNFDDSEKEPTVLPALVPNLLVNGSVGISSGYATEMPPHNLGEIVDGLVKLIQNRHLTLEELMKSVKGPDFPTGGIIQGFDGIKNAFQTGQGKILIRAKIDIINEKKHPLLKINQLPYGVVKIKLIKQINDIIYEKKIAGIKEVRDETDRQHGVQIVIELEKNTDVKTIINYLLAKTDLQVYYNYNNVVIKNHSPQLLGLIDLMNAYLEHQNAIQKSALQYDLNKALIRHEVLIGLIRVKKIVSQVINLIKSAEGSKQVVVNLLITKLKFSPIQADAIAELKLYRLSKTDQSEFETEKTLLSKKISEYQMLLNNQKAFDNYLIKLLQTLKSNFARPRQSMIQKEIEKISFNTDQLVRHEKAWIGISRQGYLKRFSTRAYEANSILEYGLKDRDMLVYLHEINTIDKLILFTSQGRFIFIPAHKIEDYRWKDVGQHVNDFATIYPDEVIISAVAINDFYLNKQITLVTKRAKGKRVNISDFQVTRTSKAMQAIRLAVDDQLVNAVVSDDQQQIVLISQDNRAWRYQVNDLPIYSLNSSGIRVANLGQNDFIKTFTCAQSETTLGLLSHRGGLKRTRLNSFKLSNRNTIGKHFFKQIKSQPHQVLEINSCTAKTQVLILTNKGYELLSFKKIEVTNIDAGFSLATKNQIVYSSIMTYQRLESENSQSIAFENQHTEQKNDNLSQEIKQKTKMNHSKTINV